MGGLAVFGFIRVVEGRRGERGGVLGVFVLGEFGGGRGFGLGHDGADALKLGRDAVGGALHG